MRNSTKLFVAGMSLGVLLNGFDCHTGSPGKFAIYTQDLPEGKVEQFRAALYDDIPNMTQHYSTLDLFGLKAIVPYFFTTLEFPDGEKATGLMVDGFDVLTLNGRYELKKAPHNSVYYQRPVK